MGLAYGAPFAAPGVWLYSSLDTIEAAETNERKSWARRFLNHPVPDLLWRVEAVRYAGCSLDVNGCENYYTTDSRLELFGIAVKKWTEHGARIEHGNRWVDLRDGAKQWASRTPLAALAQFETRRKAQIYILERQLSRARVELALAVAKPTCEHCGCMLAATLGGLEHHDGNCPNLPL